MSPRIFGIFLIISVLDQLYLVDGTNGMEESPPSDLNMESKCSAYYYLESTIKELKRKLDFYEHQLQIKDEHNKENVKQMETIYKLQSQLAINSKEKEMGATINDLKNRLVSAEQHLKFKDDLIGEKVKEIQDCDLLKTNDKQILEQTEKVNFMTVTISNLKSQLAKSREDVKVKLKDINDRTEEVKRRDDIIKLKEKEISDKSEQIKTMEDKITVKDNQLVNLRKQILTKDNEIGSLNNQTKHDLEKITEMADKITVKDNQLENLSAQILTKDNKIDSLNNQTKHDLEKITEMADKITVKDNQLEVLRAQISTKDNEIDSLNNQTKHNLETITKMTDELYTCRRRESCPTGRTNRIYKIYKPGISTFKAPCSSTGWMTILRRQGESVDFNRNWANYTNGFGNLAGDFFIGLEKLHQMTKDKPHELHIKLMKFNGKIAHAHYDNFQIGSEQELYKLISLGTYYGTAGDSLRYHEGTKFSTFDSDNDNKNNCAIITKGGWWYHNCGER